MRYYPTYDNDRNPIGVRSNEYLSVQLSNAYLKIELIDEGYAMLNRDGEKLFIITNDGMVIMNLQMVSRYGYNRAVATFFREMFGKNLLVNYSRRNYRVVIYDEDKRYRDLEGKRKYKAIDVMKPTAVFDLRLYALGGLAKVYVPKPNQYDELGNVIKKTTSEW
jgi:hypothetical protein